VRPTTGLAIAIAFLATASRADNDPIDWKFAGIATLHREGKTPEEVATFYLGNAIERLAEGHRRVWVMLMSPDELDNAKSSTDIAKRTLELSLNGYQPPAERMQHLSDAGRLLVIRRELLADEAEPQPRLHVELDCAGQRSRVLGISFPVKAGGWYAMDRQEDWASPTPTSPNDSVLKMVCGEPD
jgi:hypothetical protein